jgi:hypothetical protein
MPTVLRQDGFDVVIYNRDHPPMHVHVFKAGAETIINLGDAATKPSIRDNYRMSKNNRRKALRIVSENQEFLIQEWTRINSDGG